MKKNTDLIRALGVDHVVEQGTSGDWTYRKWNSGIAECWCDYSMGSFSPTSNFGGIYYRILEKTFPTNFFIEAPEFAEVDIYWDTGSSWASARAVSKDVLQFTAFKNSNSANSAVVRMMAKGKWK